MTQVATLLDTSPTLIIMATMLINLGSTHESLSHFLDPQKSLIDHTTRNHQDIFGLISGSTQTSDHSINLSLNGETHMSLFLITQLKKVYDGILGIAWIKHHRHLIDFANQPLEGPKISTAVAFLSYPKTFSYSPGLEPKRTGSTRSVLGCHVKVITPFRHRVGNLTGRGCVLLIH